MSAEIDLGIDGYPLDPTKPDAFYQRELDGWLGRGNPNVLPPALDWRDHQLHEPWVMAMVTRHRWITANAELLPQAPMWRMYLENLITLGLNRMQWGGVAQPETVIAVAEIAPGTDLLRLSLNDLFSLIKTWTPALRIAIHRLLPHLEFNEHAIQRIGGVAWELFLDPEDPDDGDPCWSATVRRGLRALPPGVQKRWRRLLALAPEVPHGKWQKESAKAIQAIGEEEFRRQTRAWLAPLEQAPSHLNISGVLLLRLLLEITGRALAPKWADERSQQLWQLLEPRYGVLARGGATPPVGCDGFAIADSGALAATHARIDEELRAGRRDYDTSFKRLHDAPNLEEALRTRLAWVEAHTPADSGQPTDEWARTFGYGELLRGVHSCLLRSSAALGEEALVAALERGNSASFEQAVAYTKEHGYRPAVVAAVKKLHDTLHGSIYEQTLRKHVGWWLWLDDVTPIDQAECWTGVIRQDLRAMQPKLRQAWLAVIGNMTFNTGARMPAKWSKVAQKALAKLGAEEFRTRLRKWFAVLDSEKPLNFSTPGSDLVRCLIWDYSLLDRDAETDAAFRKLTTAKWKNKAARDRTLKLTPLLGELFPDAELPQRPPVKLPNLPNPEEPAEMLKFMMQFHPAASNVEIGPDYVNVKGALDEYRVGFDGRITRRNGRKVSLQQDKLHDGVLGVWQGAIDAEDLKQGMFGVNLQRVMFIVSVLLEDRNFEEVID